MLYNIILYYLFVKVCSTNHSHGFHNSLIVIGLIVTRDICTIIFVGKSIFELKIMITIHLKTQVVFWVFFLK